MNEAPLRHRVEYGAFRTARWLWSRLPESVALRMATLLGLFAATVLRVRRRDVDAHLALAFPERDARWRRRVARACYVHLCREAVMLFRLHRMSREELLSRIDFPGLQELRRAAEGETGAVLLVGHLGNWELAGAAVAAAGIELDVVGKGMANRAFEADLLRTRERIGLRVIDMMEAPREVLRSLRSGRVVAMLADQNAHKSELFLPFFGRRAATARGPALFAIRTGAPVFFGAPLRRAGPGQQYDFSLWRMDFVPTGDQEADVAALLTEYAERLEAAIRRAPEQYFWHHRRWRTRPGEEPPESG